MSRAWSMPNSATFSQKPILAFVNRWLREATISVDPFARNCSLATYTNDINPATAAESHLDAEAFIQKLVVDHICADIVIFDPPYSPRQSAECYADAGVHLPQKIVQGWKSLRDAINLIVPREGIVLSFGWNSTGMGVGRGYDIQEILLVSHGGGHNDTICLAERKK